MSLIGGLLHRLLSEGAETVVYECRHCGTALDGERECCPNCESAAVVRYEVV